MTRRHRSRDDKLADYVSALNVTVTSHFIRGLVVRIGHELAAAGPFVLMFHGDDDMRLVGVALQIEADQRQALTPDQADLARRKCEAAVQARHDKTDETGPPSAPVRVWD